MYEAFDTAGFQNILCIVDFPIWEDFQWVCQNWKDKAIVNTTVVYLSCMEHEAKLFVDML